MVDLRQRRRICCLLLGLGLATGCTTPVLELASAPDGTRLYLDGSYAGTDEVRRDLPYYGSMAVDGLPPGQEPGEPAYAEFREILRIDPPASPWLFPLDFLFEIGAWALARDQPHRAEFHASMLEAELVVGEPPDLAGLRNRAMHARVER